MWTGQGDSVRAQEKSPGGRAETTAGEDGDDPGEGERGNGGEGGARAGHWMTQQPLPAPPWDWYGSSARGTGPHTDGTWGGGQQARSGKSGRARGRESGRQVGYARGGLLSFCNTG